MHQTSRESVNCDVSRFIKEKTVHERDAAPKEDEVMTPQDRLANLKALLGGAR